MNVVEYKSCCSPHVIPNQVAHTWAVNALPEIPYTSAHIAAISGYVLNNDSSAGPVIVNFLRGGIHAPLLPFSFTVHPGQYKSFTAVSIDTIMITPVAGFATGELNININFNPF